MRLRATFASVLRDTVVLIYDYSEKTGAISVTQDAAAVVASCLEQHGNHRMIFRDGNGRWNELLHDGENFLQARALPDDFTRRIADFCGI